MPRRIDPPESGDGAGSVPARRRYQFRESAWFKDDVRGLGEPMGKRANARLQRFMNEWRANVSETDLARKYELKIPKTDSSCRQLDLRQVRFLNKVRVYFTIIEERRTIWLLAIGFKEAVLGKKPRLSGHVNMPGQFARGIMSETDNSKFWWDAGTLEDSAREYVEESEESAKDYLRESWLAGTMALLARARWATNLTQADVAERLGTTQSAIARLERAYDTSLARFWEYLYACGVVPLETETVPFADLREFVRQQPGADRTAEPVKKWIAKNKKIVNRKTVSNPPKRKQPASRDKIPAFVNEDEEPYSTGS